MKTYIIYENEVSFNAFRMMDKDFLTSNIQSELHYCCLDRATQEQIKSDLGCEGSVTQIKCGSGNCFPLGDIRASLKTIGKILLTLMGLGFPPCIW